LRLAFAFLTRLPLARGADGAHLSRALPWFPLVGFALGGALAFGAWALAPLGEPLVAAVILVAWHALVTGGLHLDGLADCADAAGGGRGDRERMLAIMRDPHIGAHGAAALCLALIAKVALFAALLGRVEPVIWGALPAAARAVVVPLAAWCPVARKDGLAHTMVPARPGVAVAASAAWMACVLAGSPTLALAAGIGAASLVALVACVWARARLGGVTGDVHGATIELAESAFALACLVAITTARG
jgi:adenosylcobinamide-GDP ribazoletransferase